MPQSSTPQCRYQRLANGIDEFTFLSNTRAAVDDYFTLLCTYVATTAQTEPGRVMRMLIILQEPGMLPVSYMMERYRHFIHSHQDLPSTRVVYLYHGNVILSMVRSFLGLITERKHTNRQFLHMNERPQAEAWLLEQSDSTATL
jgi:hypothetical protein